MYRRSCQNLWKAACRTGTGKARNSFFLSHSLSPARSLSRAPALLLSI